MNLKKIILIILCSMNLYACSQASRNYYEEGRTYYAEQKWDKSIHSLLKAVKQKNDDVDACFWLGNAYSQKKEYDKAIEYYNKVLKLNPQYTDAYFRAGFAYFHQGNFDKSIQLLQHTILLDPDYTEAYFILGGVYFSKGDYDNAIANYLHFIDLDPDYSDAYYWLAKSYEANGNHDEAMEFYSADSVYSVIVPDSLVADTARSAEMQIFRKGDMTIVITQKKLQLTMDDIADKLPPAGLEEAFIEGTDSMLPPFIVNGLPAFARQKHIDRNGLVYFVREIRIPSECCLHIIEISLPLSQFGRDEGLIDRFVRSFKIISV